MKRSRVAGVVAGSAFAGTRPMAADGCNGVSRCEPGNLSIRTNNALVQSYSVNGLNRLTSASRSGTLTVAGGSSAPATSVTVKDNSNPAAAATLYGDRTFARAGVSLLDGTNTFTAVAADSYGRADTNTVTASLPASVSYTHDENGNLTSDGRLSYEYDDENQLVRITATSAWKSEFVYDGLGRRRVRTEYSWVNGGWVNGAVVRYVYDGQLVVQERDGNNIPAVTYTRGLDLSGSDEGAGGIGGLLAFTLSSALAPQHFYYHSDGAGNVTALVSSSQSIVGRYLYDPYGNVLAKHGLLADANLYRYSSKEAHERSGLVYFGFRYYSPSLQRWLNEDPAGEARGVNLFVFADNSPLNHLDPWGLWPIIHIPMIIKPKDKVRVDPCAGRPGGSCFSGWYVAYDWRWARSGTNSASGPKDSDKNEPRTYTTATDKLGAAVPVAGHLAGLVIDLIEAAGRFLASLGGLPTDLAWEIGRGLSSTGIPGLKQIGEYGLGTGIKHGGLLGKVWNAPNTAIGLVYGAILSGAGEVKFGNNGLQFLESQLNTMVKGDVALGNTITYSAKMGPDVKNKDVAPLGYGLHEGQHTYQGQNIGPAYLPAYVLGAVGALGRGHMYWDHFMEQGPISTTPVPWNH